MITHEEVYRRVFDQYVPKAPGEPKRLYAMQFSGNNLIKVGISVNVESRVGSVKSMALEAFAVDGDVSILHYSDPIPAHWQAEMIAHEILFSSGYHFLGEWFDATPQDATLAIDMAVDLVSRPNGFETIPRLPEATRKRPPITFAKYKNNLLWATKLAAREDEKRSRVALREAAEIFSHTGELPNNKYTAETLRAWRHRMLLSKEMDAIEREVDKLRSALLAEANKKISERVGCDERWFVTQMSAAGGLIRDGVLDDRWDGTFSQFDDKKEIG